nr:MAG TPA: hypothetical protein [Caudoviricetes sp.]
MRGVVVEKTKRKYNNTKISGDNVQGWFIAIAVIEFISAFISLLSINFIWLIVSVVMGIFTIIIGSAIKNIMHSIANIEDNSAEQLECLKLMVKQNTNKSNEDLKVE